jgi:hypothetical protein
MEQSFNITFQTGEVTFAASPAGDPVQTITFRPPFQAAPLFHPALSGISLGGTQGVNVYLVVENVTTDQATIKAHSAGDPTPQLRVQWLAIGK